MCATPNPLTPPDHSAREGPDQRTDIKDDRTTDNKLRPLTCRGVRKGWPMGALLDRAAETAMVEGVLAAVRDGLSGVLVL